MKAKGSKTMGKSANVKMGRRKMRDFLKAEKSKEGVDQQLPDQWSTAVLQFCNSQFVLRGDEPKSLLPNGQLLVKCDKMAVVTLEHYTQLLELARRGVEYERELRAAIPKLEAAQAAHRELVAQKERRVIPVSSMPAELKS
jgi:hypothetical protein